LSDTTLEFAPCAMPEISTRRPYRMSAESRRWALASAASAVFWAAVLVLLRVLPFYPTAPLAPAPNELSISLSSEPSALSLPRPPTPVAAQPVRRAVPAIAEAAVLSAATAEAPPARIAPPTGLSRTIPEQDPASTPFDAAPPIDFARAAAPADTPAALAETALADAAPAAGAAPAVDASPAPSTAGPHTIEEAAPAAGRARAGAETDPGAISPSALAVLNAAIELNLRYPPQARRRGIEGTVELRLEVAADGSLSDCALVSSSGSGLLDEAALKLLRSLFPLAAARGQAFRTRVAIAYRLK